MAACPLGRGRLHQLSPVLPAVMDSTSPSGGVVLLQRFCLWMLPPCSTTVRPKNHRRFWEAVKLWPLQQGDWDLLERMGMPKGGVLQVEESVQVDSAEFSPIPEGPLPPTGGAGPQRTDGGSGLSWL